MLLSNSYSVNPYIDIYIPKVGEVLENEEEYFNAVTLITATPYDMILDLERINIPFEKISEWDRFLLYFGKLRTMNTDLIFRGIDLKNFKIAKNTSTGERVLWDKQNKIVIDSVIYDDICEVICKILSIERKNKKPANADAKEYMLERAMKKEKRRLRELKKNKGKASFLEPVILSLVCTPEFPYNFETIKDITIYQLLAGLQQVQVRVDYDAYSYGCFAGFADMSKIDHSKFAWIKNKI